MVSFWNKLSNTGIVQGIHDQLKKRIRIAIQKHETIYYKVKLRTKV